MRELCEGCGRPLAGDGLLCATGGACTVRLESGIHFEPVIALALIRRRPRRLGGAGVALVLGWLIALGTLRYCAPAGAELGTARAVGVSSSAAGAAASAVARVAPAAGAPPLAPLEAGARSGAPSRGGRCNRCGGSDTRCLRCIASRLGRKHGGALDGEGCDGRGLMPRAELAAVGVASCD